MIEPISIHDPKAAITHQPIISYHDSEEDDDATDIDFFQEELATMDDCACYQNTYFMDGGNRFISVSKSTVNLSNTYLFFFLLSVKKNKTHAAPYPWQHQH